MSDNFPLPRLQSVTLMQPLRIVFSVLVSLVISACSTSMGHQNPKDIRDELDSAYEQAANKPLGEQLPEAVSQDLMPSLQDSIESPEISERRLRISAADVDARAFFGSLVQGTRHNLVMHPDVSGNITVSLKDVTIKEALDVVSDVYGYQIVTSGNLIQVFPATLRTQVFPVDYLQLQRRGVSLTSISTGAVNKDRNQKGSDSAKGHSADSDTGAVSTGGTVIETRSDSDFWMQLERAVSAMIGTGEGRSIVVSPQASLITVRAYPNELREVKTFLGTSQKRLKRQVVLEAKILEVTLNDGYQQGIQWNNLTRSLSGYCRVVSAITAAG